MSVARDSVIDLHIYFLYFHSKALLKFRINKGRGVCMLKELDMVLNEVSEPQSMTVIRLSTSIYSTNGKLVIKKELIPLKRKSYGYNHISDSISDCGAEETYSQIINLYDADDGIYEVVVCNEQRDWESGYVEEWDYRLVPYEE